MQKRNAIVVFEPSLHNVCPEPVLANGWFLTDIERQSQKRRASRTAAAMAIRAFASINATLPSAEVESPAKKRLLFSAFPIPGICPEPVLVKQICLAYNRTKTGGFRTLLLRVLVGHKLVVIKRVKRTLAHPRPAFPRTRAVAFRHPCNDLGSPAGENTRPFFCFNVPGCSSRACLGSK